jgi:hypothetical protein
MVPVVFGFRTTETRAVWVSRSIRARIYEDDTNQFLSPEMLNLVLLVRATFEGHRRYLLIAREAIAVDVFLTSWSNDIIQSHKKQTNDATKITRLSVRSAVCCGASVAHEKPSVDTRLVKAVLPHSRRQNFRGKSLQEATHVGIGESWGSTDEGPEQRLVAHEALCKMLNRLQVVCVEKEELERSLEHREKTMNDPLPGFYQSGQELSDGILRKI